MKFIKAVMAVVVSVMMVMGSLFNVVTARAEEDPIWNKIEKSGKLVVATSGTLYPNAFYNDKKELVGYDIDVLREVAKKLNLELEFLEMGVDGMLTSLVSEQSDVVANGFDITEKREEKYAFSTPIKYSFGSIIVREKDDSGIHSLDDFAGKKAAGGATTVFMAIAKAKGAEPVAYDNATNDQYFIDVANGRTDFIPHDYYIQQSALQYYADLGVKLGNVFYNPNRSAFVFNKEAHELKAKVDAALEELREEGKLKEISAKYFNGEDVSVERDSINGIKIKDLPVVEVEQ